MAKLRGIDGSLLEVCAEPVLDRDGRPYELTLRFDRDGVHFGAVGERCGYFLATTAARLAAAAGFPLSNLEGGVRAWAADAGRDPDAAWSELERYLPRDRELFAFRHRDPDDLGSTGELRCTVQTQRSWEDGRWRIEHCAVVDVWGDRGVGVRAVLTSDELAAFLRALLRDAAELGMDYDLSDAGDLLRRPAG